MEGGKMTDEQINIAIAESLGWESCGMASTGKLMGYKTEEWEQVPDYTADLNACHEFEKFITEDTADLNGYANNLTKIAAPSVCYGEYSCTETFALLHATARQRCETYPKTIGKWIE